MEPVEQEFAHYMKIPLNLDSNKREVFMEYFHASYRKLYVGFYSPTGQAGHRVDGSYEILLTFPVQVKSGAANLKWTMVIRKDGSLNELEVLSDELPDEEWSEAATKYVNEVLSTAFSGVLKKYFYRSYFCRIGADLDGEYWLPGFRFAPSMPEDSHSHLVDAERYFYIDQEVDAIDQIHGADIATERALRYSARLSLILDVTLYKSPSLERRWFMWTDESGNTISKREYLGFVAPEHPSQMPKKGSECRLGEFGGSVLDNRRPNGLLKCPTETRNIMRGLEKCSPNIKDAFDSCARLYQTSLVAGRGFPTIRLAYKVGAIESIVQKVDGYTSFSDFVRKESGLDDSANEFLNYLHGTVRSAHFHGGEFPLGDYQSRKWSLGLSDPSQTKSFNVDLEASALLRKSIMNWVVREIVSKGTTSRN